MYQKDIKYELQHILLGKKQVSHSELIQAIAGYLRASTQASAMAKTDKHYKEKETESLISYINKNKLWVKDIDFSLFISQGAEQRVFIKDEKYVVKLNDAIYYLSWEDYMHNLLLNNYFFPDTAYQLLGFYEQNKILYAVVKQPFVCADAPTDLSSVKMFMDANGFQNTRNNDYYNSSLGIVLEDLHDENVLTHNEILYFIDTVFYVESDVFWK